MSDATTFIDLLKKNEIHEAIGVIKESLSARAKGVISEVRFEIAESFKMSKKSNDNEDDNDDDDKDDSKDKDDVNKDDVNKDDPNKKEKEDDGKDDDKE